MNIQGKKIWQQAAGDKNRDYADICIQWGVILDGPGYAGPFSGESIRKLQQDNWSKKKIADLNRFCSEMAEGDLVVLRLGTNEVVAVGEVVSPYEWNDAFGDIDGWDLQHVRRVKWYWSNLQAPKRFQSWTLKLGDPTQLLTSEEVRSWLKNLELSEEPELPELPKNNVSPSSIQEIAEYLFDQGTSSNSIESLLKEIGELQRISTWYSKVPKHHTPSEDETRAYLIVPLLRALGWTPQKMAIGWNKIDLALFENLPREDKNLIAVVEAKKKGMSCLTAKSQAESYAGGKENCNRLIVSDGIRYGVFIKQRNGFELHAYMNLTRFKDDYPVYPCKGIKEALRAMTLGWLPKPLEIEERE
jgi:hypothetical protein